MPSGDPGGMVATLAQRVLNQTHRVYPSKSLPTGPVLGREDDSGPGEKRYWWALEAETAHMGVAKLAPLPRTAGGCQWSAQGTSIEGNLGIRLGAPGAARDSLSYQSQKPVSHNQLDPARTPSETTGLGSTTESDMCNGNASIAEFHHYEPREPNTADTWQNEELRNLMIDALINNPLEKLPVPGFRDAFSPRQGDMSALEIVEDQMGGQSDDSMHDALQIIALASRGVMTPELSLRAQAFIARQARRYADFHEGGVK
jgi:hypothetical protein